MFRMHRSVLTSISAFAISCVWISLLPANANAQSIFVDYQATLLGGVPESGSVSTAGTSGAPEFAAYYAIFGVQGEQITVTVERTESDLDPALWVFEGLYTEVAEFGGFFDAGDPRFIDFADDEIPNDGPFGDPTSTFTLSLPGNGAYTLAVTNFASGANDGGDGFFDFTIRADGNLLTDPAAVPEPSSAVMVAVFGLAFLRRRRA